MILSRLLPLLGKNCMSPVRREPRKSAQIATPGSRDRRHGAFCHKQNLGQSARILFMMYTKVAILFYVSICAHTGYTVCYCISWGVKISIWELKIICMRVDRDIGRPITVAAHRLHSGMIWDGTMTKSFVALLRILMIRWVPGFFADVGVEICAATTQSTNVII